MLRRSEGHDPTVHVSAHRLYDGMLAILGKVIRREAKFAYCGLEDLLRWRAFGAPGFVSDRTA